MDVKLLLRAQEQAEAENKQLRRQLTESRGEIEDLRRNLLQLAMELGAAKRTINNAKKRKVHNG